MPSAVDPSLRETAIPKNEVRILVLVYGISALVNRPKLEGFFDGKALSSGFEAFRITIELRDVCPILDTIVSIFAGSPR
jgi:hypothetical protein